MKKTLLLALLATSSLFSLFATGCAEKTEMSKADQENFNGGPMPAGFLDKNGPKKGPQ